MQRPSRRGGTGLRLQLERTLLRGQAVTADQEAELPISHSRTPPPRQGRDELCCRRPPRCHALTPVGAFGDPGARVGASESDHVERVHRTSPAGIGPQRHLHGFTPDRSSSVPVPASVPWQLLGSSS